MLTEDENLAQIHQWLLTYKTSSDEKIKKQLQNLIVVASMPFVKRIACGLARRSTDPVDDLIQVGSLGLIKAIDLYKPEIGTKFKTYATYLITGEIRHYLRDKASMIKAPREIQELAFRINCVIKQLTEDGQEPTSEQVAEAMSLPVNKVNDIIEVDRRKSTVSLDQTFMFEGDDAISLADKLPSGDYQEFLDAYEEKIMLSKAISKLKPKLKEVIELNYYEDLNQREISEKLNISQMQVSRRLKQALNDIYKLITRESKVNS
ncbi:MAG: sigma-70 family RNA polymerase sigma factor [Candidatus Gastranaerophilales bacterium]|nr:sigma-70 family RNA polymerase sigma factor [Candidatus Gastranaerophilales bacterium]